MSETTVDAVVVGAGFAGLYATHRLRNQQRLSVRCFEAGSGPGGVWYWNRYPGARCDFESSFYSFSFDEDLQREWRWTERYASQPEILAYLEHVADRFDLNRSYQFGTRVTSAVWDDAARHWVIGTDDGAVTTARFFVNATGGFSVDKPNDFPGQETFRGTAVRTSRWPAEGVDLAGKRVAVIGTGSTGIQVIQTIAPQVAELTVFQRTANYACPLGNRPLTDEEFEQIVADYPRLREESRNCAPGAAYPRAVRSALADTPEERRRTYDQYYQGGGFRMLVSTYHDLLFNAAANETAADYIRDRIRQRVDDPATAELMCPTDHPYATKRATFESGYYETFNLPHVRLVDARTTPIVRITEKGIATTVEEYEFDVIVLATGFDLGGAVLKRMGVVGRDGRKLTDHWAGGDRAFVGMATHGFPNLFHINGPQGPAALYNNPIAIEDSVEFVGNLIARTDADGHRTVEATHAAEERYDQLVQEVADATLVPTAVSWYMGDNIPGKPRKPISLLTGGPMFRAICAEVEGTGYAGFSFDGDDRGLPTTITIDGAAVFLLAGMMNMGVKPLEGAPLEEIRTGIESFRFMQLPMPADVDVSNARFPTQGGERTVRLYRPPVQGPLPVVVFLHGGGWVAGSLDLYDEPCASLARRLGALVVSPDYRLAPEDPFPAAVDDTMAALRWAAERIAEFGGDPGRIAVGGESAGANLAAVAALRARDEDGPRLVAQILVTPPVDFTADTKSREKYAAGPLVSNELGARMAAWYLGDPANVTSPWASPALAGDLSGLPPALVATMEIDPLRDEGEDYARALADAGVPVDCRRFAGLVHTTFTLSGAIPRAAEIQDAIRDFLTPLFAAEDVVGTPASVATAR